MSVINQFFDYIIRVDSSANIPASGLVPGQLYADTSGNLFIATSSTTYASFTSGSTGTVTSVQASGPSGIATWSGGPVTTSGTLTQSLSNQSANLVLAGPSSGSAATPAFRTLSIEDFYQWTPTVPATPYAWWKADAGVYKDAGTTLASNTDTVQQWNDQSGNGHNLSQATSGKRPVYNTNVWNSLAGITWDGVDDCLQLASAALASFTIGMAFKSTNNAGVLIEQSAITDSNNGLVLYSGGSPTIGVRKSATRAGRDWNSNWGAYKTWTTVAFQYGTTGTYADLQFLYGGNFQAMNVNATYGSSDPGTSTVTDTLNVGSRNNGASVPFAGTFGEIVIYTPAISTNHVKMLSNYLQHRWGAFA